MRADLPPDSPSGPYDELQDLWSRLHGVADRAPRLRPLAPVGPARPWPGEVNVPARREHHLPGPPGGYAAGLALLRTPDGGSRRAAPEGSTLRLPDLPDDLKARWELPGLGLPLPGAAAYVLDGDGLSAFLPKPESEVRVAVAGGSAARQEVRLEVRRGNLRVQPPLVVMVERGEDQVFRVTATGEGELQARAGQRPLGRVKVDVLARDEPLRCELHLEPSDLRPSVVEGAEVRLRLVRRSGRGAVEAGVHVAVEPEPIHLPLRLEVGEDAAEATVSLRLEQFPRVEQGSLVFLLLVRGQPAQATRLPFRRPRLRRNLPRVDLLFSRYEPRPQRHLVLRRSDGEPVDVDLEVGEDLRPFLEVRRLEGGRFRVSGVRAPEAVLDLELKARDRLSGLEERIPVRLGASGRKDE